ncbi:hypothetical protein [Planifilum fulgidum]|uniref:hypothetical protein n=1 Tax=Planifilum fulgidum TaxID=201973 RepID=UPI0011603C8F|nr:hypothetical protein [Planifilum fulgidum]
MIRHTLKYGPNTITFNLYTGQLFTHGAAVIIPRKEEYFKALWAFASSSEFNREVRKIDKKVSVAIKSIESALFDFDYWQRIAAEMDDPRHILCQDLTQWSFHGHPAKAEAHTVLQVAVARLLGYCWPAEQIPEICLATEAREARDWVNRCRELVPLQATLILFCSFKMAS